MKQIAMILVCMFCAISVYAKPQCQGFNNYDNKVTVTFTDDKAGSTYVVSDVKLVTCGKEYAATSVQTEVTDGIATVTLTFPHITHFSNPKVTLRINNKKSKFPLCH